MIKNIIFDVGGVLIGYRWKNMLIDDFGLDEAAAERVGHSIFECGKWTEFDRGGLSVDELVGFLCSKYPADESIIKRFFERGELMREKREKAWKYAGLLKNMGYRIYVLSNYSEYLFNKHTDIIPFINDLDGRVVSYEVGCVKPEKEIYKILLDKYSLNPEECIFFDDLKANTDAAEEIGIKSYTVESEEHLVNILKIFTEKEFGMI